MKKFLLLTVSVFFACTVAFSQGHIKNNSYFSLSMNRPIMKYGNIDGLSCSNNMLQYYKDRYDEEGDLQHYAGALTVGANFYIHPIGWVIEGFKAGLCVDFIDLSADYYRFEGRTRDAGGKWSEDSQTYNDLSVAYSLNIGAIATISPAEDFYIDLTAKLCPTFGVNYFRIPAFQQGVEANSPAVEYRNAGLEWGGYEVKNQDGVGLVNEEDTGLGLGLDYSFGFNIRYSKVFIGCEWIFGKINYSYDVWDKQKVYNQRLRVKLGLSFD